MIQILNKTDKYNIDPKKVVTNSFDSAFEKTAVTIPVRPPETLVTVFTVISLLLLAGMLYLTALYDKSKDANSTLWFTLGTACFGIIAFYLSKYFKSVKLYKDSLKSPAASKKDKQREAFCALFELDEMPEQVNAMDLQRKVSSLMGKQTDATYLAALRQVNDKLAGKNNPQDLLCKMISTEPEVFKQPKRRLYLKSDSGNLVFYDSDFMNPIGEIVCDSDDVVGFGEYENYPGKINNPGGGKIRPDAIIVEIKDEKHNLFFEFRGEDYDALRKILGGKKEIKA